MGKLVLTEVKAQGHTMAHNFRGPVPFLCKLIHRPQLRTAALRRTYAEILVFSGNGLVKWRVDKQEC